MSRGSKAGFSLIEALVAAALTAIAITALMGSLSAVTQAYSRIDEREQLNLLAQEKLDEVLALGDAATSQSGDFTEEGVEGFFWETDVQASGRDGLLLLTMIVTRESTGDEVRLERLVVDPPDATEDAAA
jgi:type II secretion system protein I